MSYLTLPDGIPDFTKAVISMWFRVPLSSINAAIAQAAADGDTAPRLSGIIPLLTFGPLYEGYKIVDSYVVSGSYTETIKSFDGSSYHVVSSNTFPYSNRAYSVGAATEVNPSFIGVFCHEYEEGVVTAELGVRIQMSNFGSGSWLYMEQPVTIGNKVTLGTVTGETSPPQDTAWDYALNACFRDGVTPDGPWNVSHGEVDTTGIFAPKDGPDAFVLGNSIAVAPDKWHHALISVDLSRGEITASGQKTIFDYPDCSLGDSSFNRVIVSDEIVLAVSNPAKMWIAFDDVNFVGDGGISGRAPFTGGLGNNDVAPENAYQAATGANSTDMHMKTWANTGCVEMWTNTTTFGMPQYEYDPTPVPAYGHVLGIPAVPDLLDRIHPVEMAELQIFTGVTLDTSDTAKRRAFIDADGKPVNPADAEALLGKKPDVLLHGSGNWIHGNNTGPPDVPDPITGNPIPDPAKALTPTGKIVAYTPDPSLGGDQGPSPSLSRSQAATCQ